MRPQPTSRECEGTGGGCHGMIRRDDEALSDLAQEWDELYRRCPHATPFQTSAWVESWWREYGSPGGLRLVLVRRAGRLVAAAPLMLRRRAAVPVLQAVGTGISDWSDVLVDPQAGTAALDALRETLLAEPGWQAVDLPEVAPGGQAHELLAGWQGPRRRVPASTCQQLSAAPLEEVAATLSSTHRANVRRALRKLDRAGPTARMVPADEVPAAVHRLLELHRRQWRARGGMTPEHGRPRFARHVSGAAEMMVRRDQAALCEYLLDGRLMASSLLLIGSDAVGGYLYGAEPELFDRFNVTTLLMRTAMDVAAEHDCPIFSMLRGREDHKTVWRPEVTRNDRLVLCRPGGLGVVYASAVDARARAVDRARTHGPALLSTALRARRAARNPRLAFDEVRDAVGRRVSSGRTR